MKWKKKNRKKENLILTPLQTTEALQAIGEEFDRKKAMLFYSGILFAALILGLLFEVNIIFLIIIGIVYVLCVPQLLFNQSKFAYETRRFNDINSYMSQMAQSFIYTQDIIESLRETATCFSRGLMTDTLMHAFEIIDSGKTDIKQAERDALLYIESRYGCEKLHNMHSFFLSAEELGGECQKEFTILENMRIAWQGVVENGRSRRYWERNIGACLFALFLGVAIMMLHIMRNSDLDIMALTATQVVDSVLLIGFVLYFVFMDNRLNKSLLTDPVYMTEEKAKAYYEYLDSYNAKEEWGKYKAITILSIAAAGMLLYLSPSWMTLGIAIALIFVGCNIHTLVHIIAVNTMKKEIAKAFPKWLFDVMLLLQRESVEGAFEKSVKTAPPVLKPEISRINKMLTEKPHDPDAYMSFLRDFGDQGINEIMHKLYSLAVGANRDAEVLDVVMEKNIKALEKSERDTIIFMDSMKNPTWVPFICAGFSCLAYLVIAIMTSIDGIIQMI